MTAFPRVRSEAPAAVTLRRTEDLVELLTVVLAFAPASLLAGFMTRWTYLFGLGREDLDEQDGKQESAFWRPLMNERMAR